VDGLETRQKYGRDTVIEVNLDAIVHNVRQFRQHLPAGTEIMAVVKANAYGHGAVQVARAALEAGASQLGVAFVDEGIELRQAGITAPILILGFTPEYAIADALKNGLAMTVYSEESLNAIEQEAARLETKARIHVKVDTGMGRLGLFPEEAYTFVQKALRFAHIQMDGLFTHYATADEEDKTYALQQERQFARLVDRLARDGIEIPFVHIANSAGALELPDRVYRMARIGISLYGLYPSAEVNHQVVRLKPALTLKTKIVELKRPPAGFGISYGKTYTVSGNEWIAVVSIGYADGVNRHLSNRGHALVRGKKVPIVGRVCMDQMMLNVTEAMPVKLGDEVVIYGEQQGEAITVDEVAKQLGTINYEVTCMLSHRIPRLYLKNGQVVEVVNRLRLR
jgi:alanine racemase